MRFSSDWSLTTITSDEGIKIEKSQGQGNAESRFDYFARHDEKFHRGTTEGVLMDLLVRAIMLKGWKGPSKDPWLHFHLHSGLEEASLSAAWFVGLDDYPGRGRRFRSRNEKLGQRG